MIGKPEWFTRRKYGGWGLFPKTWQGYVYIAAFIIPFVILQALTFWTFEVRLVITIVWLLILAADTIDIMVRLKRDERERIHEAIAERNALWAIIIILAGGLAYQISQSAVQQKIAFDPVIAAALIAGLIIKAISNIYLDRRN